MNKKQSTSTCRKMMFLIKFSTLFLKTIEIEELKGLQTLVTETIKNYDGT